MRLLFIFLFLFLNSIISVNAVDETPSVVETNVNISIRGYFDVNANESRVNISIFTVDGIFNYNALNKDSVIFESKEINFVEYLSCPISNVTRLAESIDSLNRDIICEGESCAKRWADCKEQKAHIEETKTIQDQQLASYIGNPEMNITTCVDQKTNLQTNYNNLQTEFSELNSTRSAGENYWLYALFFGGIVGAGLYWGFGD